MASHDDSAPAMDYAEHERTYKGFILFTEVGTVACLNIVLVLLIWGIKHSGGWALIGLLMTLAAGGLGALAPNLSWRPGAVVLVLLGLLAAIL